MALAPGARAPDFILPDQTGAKVSLSDLLGAKILVVFMPFAFTRVCSGEMCAIRDNLSSLTDDGTKLVVITCDTAHSNRRWAEDNGFEFPILSDFWPHGAVAQAHGCFDEQGGYPNRSTFILDAEGIVRQVTTSAGLRTPREIGSYQDALAF